MMSDLFVICRGFHIIMHLGLLLLWSYSDFTPFGVQIASILYIDWVVSCKAEVWECLFLFIVLTLRKYYPIVTVFIEVQETISWVFRWIHLVICCGLTASLCRVLFGFQEEERSVRSASKVLNLRALSAHFVNCAPEAFCWVMSTKPNHVVGFLFNFI